MGRFTQNKSIVAVGVEHAAEGRLGRLPIPGRVALAMIPDVTTASVHGFVDSRVKRGSVLWTDKFSSYGGLSWRGYPHAAIPLGAYRVVQPEEVSAGHSSQAGSETLTPLRGGVRLPVQSPRAGGQFVSSPDARLPEHQHHHLQRLSGRAGGSLIYTSDGTKLTVY